MRRHIISVMACIAVILPAVVSCDHGRNIVEKFAEIDSICDTDQKRAMSMLDSIDYGSLSEKQRHRYDFLQIKTCDKAYIRHTTDSLVIDVIDYYSKHREEGLYPEALYYGGRVYSDMGDFPTAIGYFQDALDVIPDDMENLKGNISSQTGHLLEELRQHNEAIPYFRKTIESSISLNDSTNLTYDWIMLAMTHLHAHDYTSSRYDLNEALRYANTDEDIAWINVVKASILLEENEIGPALILIRENLPLVDSTCYNFALANAADIYRLNGLLDTTYMYAKELATSSDFNNRIVGYDIIFSKELLDILPKDTLLSYISGYKQNIDDYLNRYDTDETLINHYGYNYDRHVRKHKEAEKTKNLLIVLIVIVAMAMVIVVGFLWHINMKKELRLRKTLNLIHTITIRMFESGMIGVERSNHNEITSERIYENERESSKELPIYVISDKKNDLKGTLLSRLSILMQNLENIPTVDNNLQESEIIEEIHNNINNKSVISYQILEKLEKSVHESCSKFKEQLMILTLCKMTRVEYEVALLIRAGISPKDIAILLNRTKSTISDRRSSLAKKIFGASANNHNLDLLIFALSEI